MTDSEQYAYCAFFSLKTPKHCVSFGHNGACEARQPAALAKDRSLRLVPAEKPLCVSSDAQHCSSVRGEPCTPVLGAIGRVSATAVGFFVWLRLRVGISAPARAFFFAELSCSSSLGQHCHRHAVGVGSAGGNYPKDLFCALRIST